MTSDADYDTYGLARAVTGVLSSVVTRFGYAGEYTDPTGYTYLRHRYYDPSTASFLSIDPLLELTRNPYGYTDGNPLQFVDPLGLAWWNPLDWDPDVLDTVSAVAGGAALVLAATGVGAPVAAVLGGVAVTTSAVATVNRVRRGDDLIDIGLSAVGLIPGVGGPAAAAIGRQAVRTARNTGVYTRGTGSTARAIDDVLLTYDTLSFTPWVLIGGARALWCAGVL